MTSPAFIIRAYDDPLKREVFYVCDAAGREVWDPDLDKAHRFSSNEASRKVAELRAFAEVPEDIRMAMLPIPPRVRGIQWR
jgi:hypothetical protein